MPLIKNETVAVYHCKEIQEALTLWHQKPRFFLVLNAYLLRAKSREVDVPAQREKALPFAETPRELALTETSYTVRQKPKNGY